MFCTRQESAEETMKELGRFHNNEKVIVYKIVPKTLVLRKRVSLLNIANIHMWFRDSGLHFNAGCFC